MRRIEFSCDRCGKALQSETDLKLVAVEADDDVGMHEVAGKQVVCMEFCAECLDQIVQPLS